MVSHLLILVECGPREGKVEKANEEFKVNLQRETEEAAKRSIFQGVTFARGRRAQACSAHPGLLLALLEFCCRKEGFGQT